MFFRIFGLGTAEAFGGSQTEGTVTDVKTCWWFKVNTKPVRFHGSDVAVYPHIIRFSYQVDGRTYEGRRWVMWNRRCPVKGEALTVHYEPSAPEKYAVIL